jgi:glutamate carboxypeptidase
MLKKLLKIARSHGPFALKPIALMSRVFSDTQLALSTPLHTMEIATLKDWININSGSLNQEGLSRMADALSLALAALPGRLERIPGQPYTDLDDSIVHPGDCLCLHFNESAPIQILLSGHMDTVFGVDHPFQSCWEDGALLRGPGVADMKGGLFVMIAALKAFLSDGPTRVGGKVLINGDEEIGSIGSGDLLRSMARACHLGLVFESALPDGALINQRKGTATIRLIAKGIAAHTGRDFSKGRNALVAMADLANACHGLNQEFPEALLNVGRLQGGGPVNVVPDYAEAWLNIRTDDPEMFHTIITAIEDRVRDVNSRHPDIRFEMRTGATRLPRRETAAETILRAKWNGVESALGLPCSGTRSTGGTSDGNIFAEVNLPHLDGVGVHGGDIHSDQEFCLLESIPTQIAKTTAFLRTLETNGWSSIPS